MAADELFLAELISALRAELREVRDRAGNDPVFRFDHVDLKVQVAESRDQSGEVRLGILKSGLGGELSTGERSGFEISLRLNLLNQADRDGMAADPHSIVDYGIATGGGE